MKLLQKILVRFNGLHYKQDYLCLANELFQQPLHLYLTGNKKLLKDISKQHLFVGYSPVIFAITSLPNGEPGQWETIQIAFCNNPLQENEVFNEKDAIALLFLKKIQEKEIEGHKIFFYEGVKGVHNFLSGFHQFIISLHNKWYNHKPGNVFLKENLFTQVQIAYSVPRKICLITVGENNLYNLFPTDLHGQVNDQYYIISLRHEGKACRQVLSAGKILLSDMQAGAYKKIYALGKNHMHALKEKAAFDFSPVLSTWFILPLPNGAVSYKELELQDSFVYGIHKLLLFTIRNREQLNNDHHTLAHIHNSYATWRRKKGMESNYLLR